MPNFSGWLQRCYLEERRISTSKDDWGNSGKSSWSKLFGRLDIKASDLVIFGGTNPETYPALHRDKTFSARVRPLRPGLADILVENESVSYGFSAAEFAALLIICGFPPSDFAATPGQFTSSTSHFGRMLLDKHGPFSQVAQFDANHNFREQRMGCKQYLCEVPVACCLRLAFGVIRTENRCGREFIILPDSEPPSGRSYWHGYPQTQQIKNIQYSFERFVGVGEISFAEYGTQRDDYDQWDVALLKKMVGGSPQHLGVVSVFEPENTEAKYPILAREVLAVAYAISSLQPWALLPVLPKHIVIAFQQVLGPFYRKREHTVDVLRRELENFRVTQPRADLPGSRSCDELNESLSQVVGEQDRFFRGSWSCSAYHEAMCRVFRHHHISQADVRSTLAASAASKLLWPDGSNERSEEFEANMRARLGVSSPFNVPNWAIDVYANFLWGWLTDSIPADPDIISYFRRRIFLA
ncbi:hypothetical protein P7C71_g5672, partial [Lecanoromycetidae sp. Uapishka_2]